MRIPIESGDASDQDRSAAGEQLDDGIGDTFVSALLLMSACHKGCRVSSQANEEIADRVHLTVGVVSQSSAFTHGLSRRTLAQERGRTMSDVRPIVFVVDDDVSVRESLELIIPCKGWQPETFASA